MKPKVDLGLFTILQKDWYQVATGTPFMMIHENLNMPVFSHVHTQFSY